MPIRENVARGLGERDYMLESCTVRQSLERAIYKQALWPKSERKVTKNSRLNTLLIPKSSVSSVLGKNNTISLVCEK